MIDLSELAGLDQLHPVELALEWARRGAPVLAVNPDTKAPWVGKEWEKKATLNQVEIHAMWYRHPEARVGIKTGLACGCGCLDGPDVLDFDVSDGKPGIEQLQTLVNADVLDGTKALRVKTPSGGQHWWFSGSEQHNKQNDDAVWGIDLRAHHGMVLAPGNPGYDIKGVPWSGLGPSPAWAVVAACPGLRSKPAASDPQSPAGGVVRSVAGRPSAGPKVHSVGKLTAPIQFDNAVGEESPLDWYCNNNDLNDLLRRDGWTFAYEHQDRFYWVRPGKDVKDGISANVYLNPNDGRQTLVNFSTSVDLPTDRGLSAAQYYAHQQHRGDTRAAARQIRTTMMPPRQPANRRVLAPAAAPAVPSAALVTTRSVEVEKAPILLPTGFFDGCPELEIIRQAAHARFVSPTALAMVMLARIASMADHRLRLPALVGSHVGLSFFTVLTAKVGGGKSSTVNLATELLGEDPTSTREVEVITGNGTGEGLIQKHMGKDDGNPKGPLIQVLHNVFWYIDEGMNLVKEFERRGSQAAGILCSGWFCAGVGQNNATGELQRSLRPLSYNWGIVIAIQDDNAHHLLDQQGIGLTQRCFWVEGWDPTIPDPDNKPTWPGTLDWRHPPMPGEVPIETRGKLSAPAVDESAVRHITLPAWYSKEQEWALYKQKQGGKVDALSEHTILMEIKLATLIGMLRGHIDPTDDDIRRARLAVGAHKRQIRRAANRIRVAEAEETRLNAQRAAERTESRAEELERRFRDKVLALVASGTTTWRAITTVIRGPVRKEMGGVEALSEILGHMLAEGSVVQVGGDGGDTVYSRGRAVDALVDAPHTP